MHGMATCEFIIMYFIVDAKYILFVVLMNTNMIIEPLKSSVLCTNDKN